MINLENETKDILRTFGIVADKRFGQNFLINEEVVNSIIESAQISKDDLIIEIGPGLGTLTKYLLEKAGKVVCVELDKRMIDILQKRFFMYNNIEIINNDILKVNLNDIINVNNSFSKVKVVANLPYYITSPIIMKLLEEKTNIDTITIMVQREVADRLVADPGGKDFGVLTLSVQYYSEPSYVVDVPRTSFIPSPNVDSAVVMLKKYKEKRKEVKNEKVLFELIKGGFAQRRKLFVNSIETMLTKYKISKEEFIQILNNHGIDDLRRAETLSLDEFIEIANDITYLKICRE